VRILWLGTIEQAHKKYIRLWTPPAAWRPGLPCCFEGPSSPKFEAIPAFCIQACPALWAPGLYRAFFRARHPCIADCRK
jgi:hypothetical protein